MAVPWLQMRSLARQAPGTRRVYPIGTWVAKLTTASHPRIALTSAPASKRSPRTGSAPRAATTAAALDDRASPTTVCPASWRAGMVDRPMTPLAPVRRTFTYHSDVMVDPGDEVWPPRRLDRVATSVLGRALRRADLVGDHRTIRNSLIRQWSGHQS